MKMYILVCVAVFTAGVACSEIIGPPQGRLGTWTESREDMPGVIFVHRHGRVTEVTRIPGTGEDGVPLQFVGPSEVSMKWADGFAGWPDGVDVLAEEIMHDDVILIRVAGDAGAAAALLAATNTVLYAYPVEFTNPVFSRVMPTDRIIARLESGVTVDQITDPFGLEIVAEMSGSTVEYILRLIDPKSSSAAEVVAALTTSHLVEWAQRDCLRDAEFYHTPTDPQYVNQWHLNATGQSIGGIIAPSNVDVDAPAAWNTTRGANSVVAVIDDAIETGHPDLSANISTTGAWDFYNNDNNPNPDGPNDLHGTAVAGVIGAVENNSIGVVGVAHGSPIVPIKICSNGVLPYDAQVANSVRHAAQYADIITCSWGYVNPAPATLSSVRYALQSGAGGRGSVVFYAVGNDGGFIPHMATLTSGGNYNLRWRYTKDASISAGLDKCFVDSVWYPNGATEFFDGLTVPNLPIGMTSGGVGPWSSLAETAGSRAESGVGAAWQFIASPSIANSQTTYAQIANNTVPANSPMWYYMRVSAQPTTYVGSTATIYDYGQLEYQLVGALSWTTANVQGGQPDTLSYPAQYPETIAVGANDVTSRRSHYSQWSSSLDFVAPSDGAWAGLGIETTDRAGGNGYDPGNYCQAGGNSKFGGTSSSTPLAAGIGALVRSANVNLSPAQVRNVLRQSCRKIDPSWYSYSGILGGKDQYVGWGQVDANSAVSLASSQIPIGAMAMDLLITEVSPVDADCPFVEIFNNSITTGYPLDTIMLTDCETGGDQSESSAMFPQGMVIPPQGILIVALGAATSGLVNDLTLLGTPPGTIQLFEGILSGLTFTGMPIGQMIPQNGIPGITLAPSDNIALVITPGMPTSYLPDVIDGMAYGTPVVNSGCAIGVAPGFPEPATFPSGATLNYSYQRNGVIDTQDSLADFSVAARTPGWIAFGAPVTSFVASPLTSAAIELEVQPDPTTPIVMIAASVDPLFDHPAQGMFLPVGAPLGTDIIIYNGPVVPTPPIIDSPYPPNTPVYYRAWSVTPGGFYSAGIDASAATLPLPIALPFADIFTNATLDAARWPYTPGASVDNGMFSSPPLPSPSLCAQLDNLSGTAQMASIGINASTTPNVKLSYWLQEAGVGDPPDPTDFLEVQILDPTLTWQAVAMHPAMGASPFLPNEVVIAPAMLHAELRVRFISRSTNVYPGDLDHWFIDDVLVTEFPVLSGFQWQPIPGVLSSGIPFDLHLSALSSMGGVLFGYGGSASLALYATNGAPSAAIDPNLASGFVSGIWSNALTIAGEDALHVVLVADDNGQVGTSSVFKVFDDLDGDNMTDSWEFDWFGAINIASNSPATDWDNDLFPDYSEFVAGTNPTNPASLLELVDWAPVPSQSNKLYWTSVATRWYDIERKTNLNAVSWSVLVSNLPAQPPTNYWVDTSAPTNRAFYRVKVKQTK